MVLLYISHFVPQGIQRRVLCSQGHQMTLLHAPPSDPAYGGQLGGCDGGGRGGCRKTVNAEDGYYHCDPCQGDSCLDCRPEAVIWPSGEYTVAFKSSDPNDMSDSLYRIRPGCVELHPTGVDTFVAGTKPAPPKPRVYSDGPSCSREDSECSYYKQWSDEP